ncbi:MAG: peptidase T [Bacteroidales bacterium]|nr:peptidase T [Bacteroidales bacterium]
MENILERFLRYVAIDTQSDDRCECQPSTAKQFDLQKLLQAELQAMGISAEVDEYGYLMAAIPSNTDKKVDSIGFIAHVDTSPDCSGKDVKPQIVENYNGEDIVLNAERNIILSVDKFPELKQYHGKTIITTDGTTLLGADDKAGVAAIMYAVEYLQSNPNIKHGDIKIAFTPDEEVGRGTEHFDVEKFGAKYAYTIDGGEIGELEYENFNAASADITIVGEGIHPGYAKDKMINALSVAIEIDNSLPKKERPQHTEGYEGFYHLVELSGETENVTMKYIIRDHDMVAFEARKKTMQQVVDNLNTIYGGNRIKLTIKDSYYNMKEKVEPHYHIVEKAIKAMQQCGVEAKVKPIRGGTDGATLSYKGLPCPNIFAGGHNFHGKYEYLPLESMQKASEVILAIIQLFIEENNNKN